MTSLTHPMTSIAPTVSAILSLTAPANAIGQPIDAITSGLTGGKRASFLATDTLGMFAWNLWKHEMPYLSSLHARNSVVLRSILPYE